MLNGHSEDDDLGSVTDRTGRVEGRTVTASSRGFFYHLLGAASQDSSCSTHEYSPAEYGVSSSNPYGDRVVSEEQERVRSLHIQGEADERCDNDGNGGEDDEDEGDDDGDEEQTVYVAPVAPASGFDRRPRHGKGKGLTGSFMSVMSKITGSHNKRLEVARDVLAPTQKRKKVKARIGSRQTQQREDCGLLKCRSRYMALTVYSRPPYPALGGMLPAE
ncbi:hypothetical protein M9H77_31756 [Catharanthus roseus]|uniref:Uncharacterized protein n=1 Tax=Catharanthus roseus TaxID=4058 RepID=A0ACC0A318_CATRO|nr:hypothetical protein M9H77_31756 [Catharanthus roseus]